MILLENQTSDTSGSQPTKEIIRSTTKSSRAEDYTVWAEGTFDSATVSLEVKPRDASSYGTEISFTTSNRAIVTLTSGTYIRGTVSGAGVSTNISFGVS